MKQFEVYKNIRKRAMIMELPISLFALMMTAVIGSLLFIIFSFSLTAIVLLIVVNMALYVILTNITKHPNLLYFKKVFPQTISNKNKANWNMKKINLSSYHPILDIQGNLVFANNGNVVLCYSIDNPEIYSLSEKDYEDLHGVWFQAFKSLPVGIVIHKQDVYRKSRFDDTQLPNDSFAESNL